MIYFITVALLNGIFISMSRTINGRLSMSVGAFPSSFWNHIVGFLFLTPILLVFVDFDFNFITTAPIHAFLGGAIGVFFVAINSYVLPRLGTALTVVLSISGQMLTGVLMDLRTDSLEKGLWQLFGVGLILFGVIWARLANIKMNNKVSR